MSNEILNLVQDDGLLLSRAIHVGRQGPFVTHGCLRGSPIDWSSAEM